MFSQHIPHQSSSADDSLRPSQHPAKHYNNVTPTFAHNLKPRVYITPQKNTKLTTTCQNMINVQYRKERVVEKKKVTSRDASITIF